MNEIVSLISFLAYLPLIHREAAGFSMFILCLSTVILNVFISSSHYSGGVPRVSYYRITSSANRTIFLFVFAFYPFLVSFLQLQLPALCWMERESVLLILVVISWIFPINMILVIDLSSASFITWSSSIADFFRTLVMKGHWSFSVVFCVYWDTYVISFIRFIQATR